MSQMIEQTCVDAPLFAERSEYREGGQTRWAIRTVAWNWHHPGWHWSVVTRPDLGESCTEGLWQPT